jgi:HPt (histidine-containing phosphotransfer) domain-containing protein
MEKTETVAISSAFDLAELLERVDNDRELLRDLLSIFKNDFPVHLQALRGAAHNADMNRVSVVSHTLKGMLLNLAAGRAAGAAARLEQLGSAGDIGGVAEALEVFESEVSELLPKLDACMTEACT